MFVAAQIAPMSLRQVAEQHFAYAHALQAGDFETDELAHAANLAFLALAQNEAQLIVILPFDVGAFERLVVEA